MCDIKKSIIVTFVMGFNGFKLCNCQQHVKKKMERGLLKAIQGLSKCRDGEGVN